MNNFPGPVWSPQMFKYKEKMAFTYNIHSAEGGKIGQDFPYTSRECSKT